jgi:DNA-binding NarL/FixJ family response regulator
MQNTTRILLVDDHALFRAGVRTLLQSMSGFEVVGESSNGRDAVQAIERLHPRVVVMDISMHDLNGIDAVRLIVQTFPGVRVIMLSMHATREYVLQALNAGAAGYLTKDVPPEELEEAVRAVAGGQTYLSPRVSAFVIEGLRERMHADGTHGEATPDPLHTLTARQREVLQLVAEGMSTKEIAQKLSVSVKTAEAHRTQLMKRLGIHDVTGLVRLAIRAGIVDPNT